MEYRNDTLDFVSQPEGRVLVLPGDTLRYEYSIRDHLGDTRVTFSDLNHDGLIEASKDEIIQESHYDPWGMELTGIWQKQWDTLHPTAYLYNNKEFNEDFGLNWSDYGARWYDATDGRWWVVDPLADKKKQESWNPYHYVFNNPIRFIDSFGMSVDTLKLGYVSVVSGSGIYHTNIIHKDNKSGKEEIIVEGFPHNRIDVVPEKVSSEGWGNLETQINSKLLKIPDSDKEVITPPTGMSEDQFITKIISQAAKYDNSVEYSTNPYYNYATGNSNSLVGSVLRASGSDFKPSRWCPGFGVNVLPGTRNLPKLDLKFTRHNYEY